jgi:hypothetical protein
VKSGSSRGRESVSALHQDRRRPVHGPGGPCSLDAEEGRVSDRGLVVVQADTSTLRVILGRPHAGGSGALRCRWWRPFAAVNSPRAWVPVGESRRRSLPRQLLGPRLAGT